MPEAIADMTSTRANYDWDTYFNGTAWRLTEGVDIQSIRKFKYAARERAVRLGYRVSLISNDPGTLDVQATLKEGT